MKKFILLLIILIFSTSYSNSNPPDDCLWAPFKAPIGNVIYPDAIDNSDSTVFIDTCGLSPESYLDSNGNPTKFPSLDINAGNYYSKSKRFYSKSMWMLELVSMPGIQVFDTIGKDLNSIEYFTVDDIDANYKEIYEGFKQTKQKYGDIKIRLFPQRNIPINEQLGKLSEPINNLILETENRVNSIEFAEFLGEATNHPCTFESAFVYPNPVQDFNTSDYRINYQKDNLYVLSKSEIHQLVIYSITGIKVFDNSNSSNTQIEIHIDISNYPTGIYLLLINNSIHKITVVR
jgi:hypothetical protein